MAGMSMRVQFGLLLMAMGPALGTLPSFGQSSQAPSATCRGNSQSDSCSKTKPAMDRFPFPAETSAPTPAGTPASQPGVTDPLVPVAPSVTPGDAGKQFPFPGKSGSTPLPGEPKQAGSSSSSSNSSDPDASGASSADADPDLRDKGSEGQQTQPSGRHILHRVNPPGTKLQSPDERVAEDLDVAHFYMDNGDFKAAYLRGQDAVKVNPDDPEAHFMLAEVALKLNKTDEAVKNYQACLKLDPSDKQAKAARRALTRLQGQR